MAAHDLVRVAVLRYRILQNLSRFGKHLHIDTYIYASSIRILDTYTISPTNATLFATNKSHFMLSFLDLHNLQATARVEKHCLGDHRSQWFLHSCLL